MFCLLQQSFRTDMRAKMKQHTTHTRAYAHTSADAHTDAMLHNNADTRTDVSNYTRRHQHGHTHSPTAHHAALLAHLFVAACGELRCTLLCAYAVAVCWAEAPIKIARMTLTIKLDRNWSSFQLANNTPPLSVTGSVIAPSARIRRSARRAALSHIRALGALF